MSRGEDSPRSAIERHAAERTSADRSGGVPRIDAEALREHGDRERIERVWERLEPKLSLEAVAQNARATRRRRLDRTSVGSLAAAAGFALGVGLAGWLWQGDREDVPVVRAPEVEPVIGIFATGGSEQTYVLPGGDGKVELRPDTTVETISREDGSVTLRLRRGDATFTAPAGAGVRVVIGDARISAAHGGQFQVRRDGDYAYLQVISGTAEITPPDEEPSVLSASRTASVRVHSRVTMNRPVDDAVNTPPRNPTHKNPLEADDSDEAPAEAAPAPEAPWVTACKRDHDDLAAARLVQQEPGAMATITDPEVLNCIAVGNEALGDQDGAVQALEARVQHETNKISAMSAAKKLVRLYEKRRKAATTDAEREKWGAAVARSKAKERELSLAALAERNDGGESLESFETEGALCSRINSEASVGNTKHVINLAALYKDAYPDGPCTATIEAILAKINVEGGAQAEPDPYEGAGSP
jgi:ferric-dicitrate binding protein FerR (iron transport regulator)